MFREFIPATEGDASVTWASLVRLQVGQSLSKEQVSCWPPREGGMRWELRLGGVQ